MKYAIAAFMILEALCYIVQATMDGNRHAERFVSAVAAFVCIGIAIYVLGGCK